MSRKNFYSVARGLTTGIFTDWSKCELSVHRFRHAVYKGFKTIDEAIQFLIAGNTYQSCNVIPVYDDTTVLKSPTDFGHACPNDTNCTIDLCDPSFTISVQQTLSQSLTNEDIEPIYDCDNTDPKQLLSENKNTTPSDTELHVQNVHVSESKQSEPSVTTRNKKTTLKSECSQSCNKDQNDHMMECSKCHKWTHYECTKLPIYQLYTLVNTSRKYTCEVCAEVPTCFKEKWENVTILPQAPESSPEVLQIATRIEQSVVTAITNIHQSNQDEIINTLKKELEDRNEIKSLCDKLDKMSNSQAQEKSQLYENYSQLSNKLDKISKDSDAISKNLNNLGKLFTVNTDKVSHSFKELNEQNCQVNSNLEITSEILSKNSTINDTVSRNLSSLCQSVKLLETSIPIRESPQMSRSRRTQDSSILNCDTSNRYQALSDYQDSPDAEQEKIESKSKKSANHKILLMGNSHVKYINTDYFLKDCIVDKLTVSTFEEANEKIQNYSTDYECVFIHFFTNDLRNNTPEDCIQLCSDLIDVIKSHCTFAKITISLPFACLKDQTLNDKIMKCNVLLQYTYLNSLDILICDNHNLGSRGTPVKKFLANDGLHLNKQGMNVFVSNIKYQLRKQMGLEKVQPHNQQKRGNNYQKRNKPQIGTQGTDFVNQNSWHGTGNMKFNSNKTEQNLEQHSPQPPFMYPMYTGFNPSMFGYMPSLSQQTGRR